MPARSPHRHTVSRTLTPVQLFHVPRADIPSHSAETAIADAIGAERSIDDEALVPTPHTRVPNNPSVPAHNRPAWQPCRSRASLHLLRAERVGVGSVDHGRNAQRDAHPTRTRPDLRCDTNRNNFSIPPLHRAAAACLSIHYPPAARPYPSRFSRNSIPNP